VRLFVALELPADVRAALVAWRPADAALRPVADADLHVTLAFLGERSQAEARAVARVLAGVARPVGGLALGAPRWLPPRRPRVLAVELADADGALTALHYGLVGALGDAIAFRPERRRFLPHVTVARVRSAPAEVELVPPGGPAPFAAPALTLFRSRLSPGGARYEALERVALPPRRG
jgi:2'-5' RNA ligase